MWQSRGDEARRIGDSKRRSPSRRTIAEVFVEIDRNRPASAHDARQLGHAVVRHRQMMQDPVRVNEIERAIGKRQPRQVALHHMSVWKTDDASSAGASAALAQLDADDFNVRLPAPVCKIDPVAAPCVEDEPGRGRHIERASHLFEVVVAGRRFIRRIVGIRSGPQMPEAGRRSRMFAGSDGVRRHPRYAVVDPIRVLAASAHERARHDFEPGATRTRRTGAAAAHAAARGQNGWQGAIDRLDDHRVEPQRSSTARAAEL